MTTGASTRLGNGSAGGAGGAGSPASPGVSSGSEG
jgi:hypothetical protein